MATAAGRRTLTWSAGLTLLLIVVIIASTAIGPVWIPPVAIAKIIVSGSLASLAGVVNVTPPLTLEASDAAVTIVTTLRLPRIMLAAVVGFALATAGTVMQGFFRNPMADPSIIGVSSGAAVGAVATIALGVTVPLGLETAAFLGALLAAFGVYLLATENGHTPVATLLLAGVAVQTFLGAVISFLLVISGDSLQRAVYWLMGHLHNSTWHDVTVALPVTLAGFGLLMLFVQDLNAMVLGEETAQTLGIDVEITKRLLLAAASLVTAIAVAVSGVIGFVGLIVPHMMRLVVGPDHRVLLPTSAITGAVFLVATDTIARSGAGELPVGIVTAFLGAPFFLYLLRKREVYAL